MDGLIKVLFDGQTLYAFDTGEPTKSDIESWILDLEYRKTLTESLEDIADFDREIAEYQALYDDAPEESEETTIVSEGLLKLETYADGELQAYKIDARTTENWAEAESLSVCNFGYKAGHPDQIQNLDATLSYRNYPVNTFDDNGEEPIEVYEGMQLDEGMQEKLGMSPGEAEQVVIEALADAGIADMTLNRMYIIYDEAEDYAYQLFLTRQVNGITCTYNIDSITTEEGEGYAWTWTYEKLKVLVNRNGMIELMWESPIEITGTNVEDAALLSFDEIAERFWTYATVENIYISDETKQLTIDIDRIAFEYQRMRIKNGKTDEALLVPVWSFYGVETTESIYGDFVSDPYFLVAINAVDGSVFNSSEGY